MNAKNETAVFGGGCFWCTEAIFASLKGVVAVTPGYAGGQTENPTYEAVCSGTTGHAEVVKIEFNPTLISYHDLLEIFFALHDPTTINQQGNDTGTQYRSLILYGNTAQQDRAKAYIAKLTADQTFSRPVVTELVPLTKFYPAENYHRDYYAKNANQPYCRLIISPKLAKLREKFSHRLPSGSTVPTHDHDRG